jgi:hypothetical protein
MFSVYALFLILSGVAMLVMAFVRTDYAKRRQVLNFILGGGFTIYGLYLLLMFNGGHYVVFPYVFILPILMIVGFFRDRAAAKSRQAAAQSRQMAANPAGGGFPPGAAPWGTGLTGPGAGNGQPPGYGAWNGQSSGYGPANGQPSPQPSPRQGNNGSW